MFLSSIINWISVYFDCKEVKKPTALDAAICDASPYARHVPLNDFAATRRVNKPRMYFLHRFLIIALLTGARLPREAWEVIR